MIPTILKKEFSLPFAKIIENIYKQISPFEKLVLFVLSFMLVVITITALINIRNNVTTVLPAHGGTLIEGVSGAPRFINPILAISQTDQDLTKLVYSGLLKTNVDGTLTPDLADSYSVSDDGKIYTFILKKDLSFNDGTPLTADDIVFTINKALQPDIKSPQRANWEGVTIKKVNDLSVKFTLNKPYAQFLQNTTIGILPQEHWSKLSADEFIFSNLNLSPIGSGPYEVNNISHDTSGMVNTITMSANEEYIGGIPYITNFIMRFYPNIKDEFKAFENGKLTSLRDATPTQIDSLLKNNDYTLHSMALSRIFAVFFNQSHNKILLDKKIRIILRDTIDNKALIQNVLLGHASPIYAPMFTDTQTPPEILSVQEAQNKLEKMGWEKDETTGIYMKNDKIFTITLVTVNSTELKSAAEYIANIWHDIGIDVKIKVFEPGDITQNVLRTRDYDALLFGEVLGDDPDLYAFWHSSQRRDPGLNVANYINTDVDKLLIKARNSTNPDKRKEIYIKASKKIVDDVPAIFLYAPNFLYVTNTDIKGIELPNVAEPHNRFINVSKWYIKTKRSINLTNN